MTTVSTIMKHVHTGTIDTVYSLLDGEYEFLEAKILETSELVGKSIKDSNLPEEVRVGAIVRKSKVMMPKSTSVFEKNDIVVLESTVYPGFSESFLKSLLEKSKLKYNRDFYIGYSPERINPGDKKHSLKNITKIISSNNKSALKRIKYAYDKILNRIVHWFSCIVQYFSKHF